MYGQLALAVAALIAPTTGTPNPALSLLGRQIAAPPHSFQGSNSRALFSSSLAARRM